MSRASQTLGQIASDLFEVVNELNHYTKGSAVQGLPHALATALDALVPRLDRIHEALLHEADEAVFGRR